MAETVTHAEMVALLIEQYKRDFRLTAFITAHLGESQEIEDAAQDVAGARDVDVAEGAALDLLGALVQQGRLGLNDEQYRAFIKGRVIVNTRAGTAPDILDLLRAVVPDGGSYQYTEFHPAAFAVRLQNVEREIGRIVALLIDDLRGAGIGAGAGLVPTADTFYFGSGTPGFASTNSATPGGEWASRL